MIFHRSWPARGAARMLGATLLVFCGVLLGMPLHAADLLDVYQRALQNDPQLREADANRLATMEAKPQALSALLPHVAANGYTTRERDNGTQDQVERISDPTDPTGTSVLRFSQDGRVSTDSRAYSADLRQSLFNWSNWVALKQADSQVAQAQVDYESARQDLMSRVAQRYFDVLAAQDDLDAQQSALNAITDQLEQAEKRFDVGTIAITDVQEARAAHDSSAATVIASKRTLATALEALREMTGDSFDALARPLERFEPANPNPSDAEQWVQTALAQNLNLISSRLSTDIARENISSARGAYAPSIDLIASAGRSVSNGDIIYSNGGAGGSTLDEQVRKLTVQVTVPLFSGGYNASQVRQAVYRHRASRERLERLTRDIERDTRDAFLGVLSGISRLKASRQSVESNAVALQATQAGYEAGTRTAVEVLESRRQLVLAQTNYSRSRYDYMLETLKLQQDAGTLSVQSLERLNAMLK